MLAVNFLDPLVFAPFTSVKITQEVDIRSQMLDGCISYIIVANMVAFLHSLCAFVQTTPFYRYFLTLKRAGEQVQLLPKLGCMKSQGWWMIFLRFRDMGITKICCSLTPHTIWGCLHRCLPNFIYLSPNVHYLLLHWFGWGCHIQKIRGRFLSLRISPFFSLQNKKE